jgi:peptidoglycan hydrolase-like protein with peptidoglycan-binding domain
LIAESIQIVDSIKKTTADTSKIKFYEAGSRILFKGCLGTDVKNLQELLIRLGYDIKATGAFDEMTKVAVKDFQTRNGMAADGWVDRNTLIFMQSKARPK